MGRVRVGVLISGRGSNLASLIAAAAAPDYPAEIALAIANVPGAGGLEHAARAGIAATVIAHRDFTAKAEFEAALEARLQAAGIELLALAGFMRVLSPAFVARWRGRLINIHPSLLPAFPGLDTHQRALEAGVRLAGCTVHFVSEAVDGGAIIGQAAVPVRPDDDAASLAARVLAAEHRLYPACLALVARGEARLEQGRLAWSGPAPAEAMLANPAAAS